jgi:hypothetical protein
MPSKTGTRRKSSTKRRTTSKRRTLKSKTRAHGTRTSRFARKGWKKVRVKARKPRARARRRSSWGKTKRATTAKRTFNAGRGWRKNSRKSFKNYSFPTARFTARRKAA